MTYTKPLLLLSIAIVLAGILRTPRGRARTIALYGVVILLLLSLPAAEWLIGLSLEGRYPVHIFRPAEGIQAVVVLASSVRPEDSGRPYPLPDAETFRRCENAAWIYRTWGPLPVLACEGRQRSRAAEESVAELLRRAGVPGQMIWSESQSRSTHENALYGARVLRGHGVSRIVLVVEARSMPRAAACFRKEGLDVIPAPSEFRTLGPWTEEVLPDWQAIRGNEVSLHEWLGLAWYRWRGWI